MPNYYELYQSVCRPIQMLQAFPFLEERGHMVSIVGGGGKTSTLYAMAAFAASLGHRVLVTTTTHIFKPKDGTYADTYETMEGIWRGGRYAVMGVPGSDGKLGILPEPLLHRCMAAADLVLVEADGSRGLPVKVPGVNEPVILPDCDIVIGIMGIDGLNQPIRNVCHRIEQAEALLHTSPENRLTAEHMVQILTSIQGTGKSVNHRGYMVVLNKCDEEERIKQGAYILSRLEQQGIKGVLSCFPEKRGAAV